METPGELAEELRSQAKQNFGNAMHATHVSDDVALLFRAAAMIDHLRKCVQHLEGTEDEEAARREAYRYGDRS